MKDKVTIIVFSNDLDKVLAAFNIATGSSAMGMEVIMFFTFWGLNVIRKKKSVRKSLNWIKRLLGLLNRGGAGRLKLSKFNMGGIGTAMMKILMKKSKFPSVEEFIRMAKDMGVKFIACNTTMELMGVSKDDLIEDIDGIAGVATYIGEAKESKLNLFI